MNFATISNFALALRENGTYTPFSKEAWEYAGQMTLLGMLMVFSVLAVLWIVLSLFKVFFAEKKPKAKTPVVTETAPKAAEPAIKATPVTQTRDEELIAVITAAIAAYMSEERGEEVQASGLRVVSFRRVSGGRHWNTK